MVFSETVDIGLLMDVASDDREIAADLVRLYFEQTRQEMLQLEAAADSGDFTAVSTIAHRCAGSSTSCGMTKLFEMLRDLERQSVESIPPDLPDQLEKIKAEMVAVKTVTEDYFNCTFKL
jgi:HPt (histidine-containing phosphotransfer) domain-containing protein